MNTSHRILTDHRYMVNILNEEENRIALECAQKVRVHLEKAFLRNQHPHFLQNMDLVDQIIEGHRQHLQQSPR